jgi:hypothetical protein
MKIAPAIAALSLAYLVGVTAQQPSGSEHRLAASMQRKLDHIKQNGERHSPDRSPTVMTEEEINDYFISGRIKLPVGVKKVWMTGQSGVVTGQMIVDFDEIRAGQRSANPLLAIFSGTHNVRVEADAYGSGGVGRVHVRTMSMDGIDVPRIALEYFANKYLKPKYPGIGLDSEFKLSNRIDVATVGYHKLTVSQR